MDACARGFISPRPEGLRAEALTTPEMIARARAGADWGDVVLLEVTHPRQEKASFDLTQPLLLTEVIGCWTRSADVAIEIEVRLGTFDDTVPGLVKVEADQSLFPNPEAIAAQDLLPLSSHPDDVESGAAIGVITQCDSVALEKVAGGLAMLRARARAGGLSIRTLEQLLSESHIEASKIGCVASLALQAYRLMRPSQIGSSDEQVFVKAAAALKDLRPREGLDPVAFIELLGEGEDLAAFLDTLRKVLDSRIELSDSKLDDSGMVGQRALLLFLLAPRAEDLERWLRARPTGPIVAALANLLSGVYCGLGGISRELKGPDPDSMLAVVQAASSLLDGTSTQASLSRTWDARAAVRECIMIGGRELLSIIQEPPEVMSLLIGAAQYAGLTTRVHRDTGKCVAVVGESAMLVELDITTSMLRVPAGQVARLTYRGRSTKRGQPSREVLATLMDRSLRPVVATVDASGSVLLEVEMDSPSSISEGISELIRAAGSAGLAQESEGGWEQKKNKPKASS